MKKGPNDKDNRHNKRSEEDKPGTSKHLGGEKELSPEEARKLRRERLANVGGIKSKTGLGITIGERDSIPVAKGGQTKRLATKRKELTPNRKGRSSEYVISTLLREICATEESFLKGLWFVPTHSQSDLLKDFNRMNNPRDSIYVNELKKNPKFKPLIDILEKFKELDDIVRGNIISLQNALSYNEQTRGFEVAFGGFLSSLPDSIEHFKGVCDAFDEYTKLLSEQPEMMREANTIFNQKIDPSGMMGGLQSSLIQPIQRPPRYEILTKELIKQLKKQKKVPNYEVAYPNCDKMLELAEKALINIKEQVQELDSASKKPDLRP